MWNAVSLVQDLNSCRVCISYDDNHYTTGNERVLCIPQNSSITGTSPSYFLVSYPGCFRRGMSYPSTEVVLVYSIAPVEETEGKGKIQKILFSFS